MRHVFMVAVTLLIQAGALAGGLPHVSSGRIERIENFPSKYVDARNVDVWLPETYKKTGKYPVIYMNDGQMLFDSTNTWNHQEWQVDEVLSSLFRKERDIRECIVVGIWNNGIYRRAEYFPEVVLGSIPLDSRMPVIQGQLKGKPRGDNYLKFVVSELKPYIDARYPTLPDPANTCIVGSSMGGLISLYALCEYPEVFRGIAGLSLHWKIVEPENIDKNMIDLYSSVFRAYLKERLPNLVGKKIYYDNGTVNLDSVYRMHRMLADQMMASEGFTPTSWMSREFEGEDHTERAWAKRLSLPMKFLLKKP